MSRADEICSRTWPQGPRLINQKLVFSRNAATDQTCLSKLHCVEALTAVILWKGREEKRREEQKREEEIVCFPVPLCLLPHLHLFHYLCVRIIVSLPHYVCLYAALHLSPTSCPSSVRIIAIPLPLSVHVLLFCSSITLFISSPSSLPSPPSSLFSLYLCLALTSIHPRHFLSILLSPQLSGY